MKMERLRELVQRTPLIPFQLLLPNGEKIRVANRDFILMHPDQRTVIVVTELEQTKFLDVQSLVGTEMDSAVHE